MDFITNKLEKNMIIVVIYCLQIQTVQFMKLNQIMFIKIFKNKNLFDFSDYLEDSNVFDFVNKKVIGKMKDELKGKIIGEFVGLK